MKRIFDEIPHIESERLTIRRVEPRDADALRELAHCREVYRYLPTFLFEQSEEDVNVVLDKLYSKCFARHESVIMGIYRKEDEAFVGLIEIYGVRPSAHKVSVGYRLLPCYWGQGLADEVLSMLLKYLLEETDTEIITAGTMADNIASAKVLTLNGFEMVVTHTEENWGVQHPHRRGQVDQIVRPAC